MLLLPHLFLSLYHQLRAYSYFVSDHQAALEGKEQKRQKGQIHILILGSATPPASLRFCSAKFRTATVGFVLDLNS